MSTDENPPSLGPDIITLGFQLADYIAHTPVLNQTTDREVLQTIQYVNTHYQDPRALPGDEEEASGTRTRSSSRPTPPTRWPGDWVHDGALHRAAVKSFNNATATLRNSASFQQFAAKGKERAEQIDEALDTASELPSSSKAPSIRRSSTTRGRTSDTAQSRELADIRAMLEGYAQQSKNYREALKEQDQTLKEVNRTLKREQQRRGDVEDELEVALEEKTLKGSISDKDKFVAADIGYFDPFYKEKSADTGDHIDQEGNKTIFRDVYIFVERVKDIAISNSKVKENLQSCLRGEALRWHANELTTLEKSLMRKSIDAWTEALLTRFKPPMEEGLILLGKEKYTLEDATRHREPREYGQARLRAAKIAEVVGERQIIM